MCSNDCHVSIFADDCKFFSTDEVNLQRTLDRLCEFTSKRQICIAPEKCSLLRIGKTKKTTTPANFYIDQVEVGKRDSVKDLGVHVCSSLKWRHHVSHVTKRGHQRSYHILHGFSTKNIHILTRAFTTFVRPILESNSVVWNPYLKQDVLAVEAVQRKLSRRVFRKCGLRMRSYSD